MSRDESRKLASLFSRRNFLLQLLKPIQHDVDLRRRRPWLVAGLEHQETLAVGRHVVVGECCWGRRVRSLKEHPWLAHTETRTGGNVPGHNFGAAAVEQLPPVRVLHRLRATFGRDLPLAARAR